MLVIQETFLNENTPDSLLNIPEYNFFRNDRTAASGKRSGGGLITYTQNKYQYEYLLDKSVCTPDIEYQVTKLILPETRDSYIINVYRPPSGNIAHALEPLENAINDLQALGTPDIIVMGDMNVDWLKTTPDSNKVKQLARVHRLIQLIRNPSRTTNTGRTLIDHRYTNNTSFYETQGVLDAGLNDHSMIYAVRKRHKPKNKNNYIFARSYRNFDEVLFSIDMERAPWVNVYSCVDANEALNMFNKIFLEVAEWHAKTIWQNG